MRTFKIRCSAIGTIMTGSKKPGELGETVKTYLQEWVKEQLYDRKKEFSNKYTDKGLTVEDNALDFIAEQMKIDFVVKNEKFFENDFITGTPDLVLTARVIDAKSSWDCFTFPLFDTEIPDAKYEWQVQGYMELTGKEKASVCYCLMDTPVHLIEKEAKRKMYELGETEMDEDFYNSFVEKMTYPNIPENLRFKRFDFDRDDVKVKAIQDRVLLCREYIAKITETL